MWGWTALKQVAGNSMQLSNLGWQGLHHFSITMALLLHIVRKQKSREDSGLKHKYSIVGCVPSGLLTTRQKVNPGIIIWESQNKALRICKSEIVICYFLQRIIGQLCYWWEISSGTGPFAQKSLAVCLQSLPDNSYSLTTLFLFQICTVGHRSTACKPWLANPSWQLTTS